MKFFVLNDQPERREGLKALLRQIDRRAKIAEAKDWRQAAPALKRERYDLFVIDWQLRWMDTADLMRLLRENSSLPAAVLVDEAMRKVVDSFLQAGALGIIPRSLDPRLILRIFELVLLGGCYIPACALDPALPNSIQMLASRTRLANELKQHSYADAVQLSPRQHQIMRLVHMGNTNKLIARALDISEGTVKIRLAAVFKLLGAANRAAAVAIYNGWQFNKLEVLNSEAKAIASKPVYGMRSPIPLRQHKLTQANYSLLVAEQTPVQYYPSDEQPALLQEQPDDDN